MQQAIYSSVRYFCSFTMLSQSTKNIAMQSRQEAFDIFQSAYKAVRPSIFMARAITIHENSITIQEKRFSLGKKIYIVGFGKAVLGMTVALKQMLIDHNVSGIISIPQGFPNSLIDDQKLSSNIQVLEGAVNNIPDENSLHAASKIKDLVSSLTESDTLIVLISGGGSALLPSPKPPLTLDEKKKLITLLSSKGATIEELNSVRKRLSLLKGGNLAALAKPATVIGLILSDIIGDPLGLIASGPTVKNVDDPKLPFSIIEKYKLRDRIPKSAAQLLQDIPNEQTFPDDFSHVHNFIVGNNQMALDAAALTAQKLSFHPIIITKELKGTANIIGKKLISTVTAGLQQDISTFNHHCDELQIKSDTKHALLDSLTNENQKLCLLFGGETTVEVNGKGIGGRNQELALAAAIELQAKKQNRNILLLSAGTDGIDGPTNAAGAIATNSLVNIAKKEGLDADVFLKNNDSFTFFSQADNGKWLIRTGHTGTNVMDIIVILIY